MKHRVVFNRKVYRRQNTAFALFILAVCLFVFPMTALADECTGLVDTASGEIDLGGYLVVFRMPLSQVRM